MIRKLLFHQWSPIKLVWIALSGLTGIFILLFSLQTYVDVRTIFAEQKDWLLPEYLIVNKKVNLLNSMNKESGFSKDEIQTLQTKPFTEQVFPFQSNQFSCAGMTLPGSEISTNSRYTDLFFEAVPTALLDIKQEEFEWNIGDDLIPIVIPTDYLNLYNFGFAPSQGLPKLSAQTLRSIRFQIMIDSMGEIIQKKGRVVAFSNRIQSILVPLKFMEYGNQYYVSGQKQTLPSRLIVKVNDPMNPELGAYFDLMDYESNRNQIRHSKLSSLLKILVYILSGIAAIIISLSLLSFVQFWKILILRNEFEVNTLLDLGFSPIRLRLHYLKVIVGILFAIMLVSALLVGLARQILLNTLEQIGFVLENGISMGVVLIGLLIFVGLVIIQNFSLKHSILTYFNKKKIK